MSTISIIIPSYNQAEYLPDAIESAYNQTTPPHEIIVIDDGSTDGSLEIARQYQFSQLPLIESPVRVVSQANKGLPMARNTGIMNATGDYILPLDADDLLVENAIERITHAIIQFNADIIAPSFRCFGKVNQDVILNNFTMEELKQTNRLGYFSAIRRSALLEVGGYSPRMKYGYEDYHLWFDLFKRGKTLNVLTDILVMYRTKDHSMLNDAQAHHEELMLQIKKDHPTVYG